MLAAFHRSARGSAVVTAVLALACSSKVPEPPTRAPTDAGRDAPAARDVSVEDAPPDAPPPDPVLPVQFWSAGFALGPEIGASWIPTAIAIDARAESGGVRAVMGANGETANVWLDVVEPGLLLARAPVDLGTSTFESECAAPFVRLSECALHFTDRDDDGIFETLTELRGMMALVSSAGDVVTLPTEVTARATTDTLPPYLETWPRHVLPGDVLHLVANEPIDPSFAPYLEGGGIRVALRPASRGTPPSSWTLPLEPLPPTTYVLRADGRVRDLAGNVGGLSELSIDLTVPPPLEDPSFETSIAGVTAERGTRALEGDEVALEGARSVLAEGRTVISLELPSGTSGITMLVRVHAQSASAAAPLLRTRDLHGVPLATSSFSVFLDEVGTTEGFPRQSAVTNVRIPLGAPSSAVLIEIDPWGTRDPRCLGFSGPPWGEPLAMTIDAISVL